MDGHNRDHAILGASDQCVAVHPSDMAVAMMALDAVVVIQSETGERTLPLEEFYRLPGEAPDRDTTLEHGDLIIAVELPALAFARRSAYRKIRDRASYAFALVSVAAALDIAGDGTVREARIALGGVAHRPWRAHRAEAALRGAPPTIEAFIRAAEAELVAAQALTHNGFKIPMARNAIVSMLDHLAGERTI